MATAQANTSQTNEAKSNRAMKLMNEVREEKIPEAKEQIQKTYEETKQRIQNLQSKAMQTVEKSVESVENRIQQNPIRIVLGAAVLGAFIGFLFSRRK